MDFEQLKLLYENYKKKFGKETYRKISKLLSEAKILHKADWEKQKTPNGDHEQSWRAFRAKKNEVPIDMDARRTLEWRDYFELVDGNSQIVLDRKTLYLLGSRGRLKLGAVCGLLSREDEVSTGTGVWGHFAGVFQPFFEGGITMEAYSFSKRRICKGDKAGFVMFDRIQEPVERKSDYGGNYQSQTPPALARMFKDS